MNIIIEGIDGVGKSTLVKKLVNKYNMPVHHSSKHTKNDFEYHYNLLDNCKNTIFDRFHIGEVVYSSIDKDRVCKISSEEDIRLVEKIKENNDLVILFTSSDVDIIKERLIARHNEDELKQIPKIRRDVELFNNYLRFSGYNNYYICNVAKPNSYYELDKWIDSKINKHSVNTAYKKMCFDLVNYGNRVGNTYELLNYKIDIDNFNDFYVTLDSRNTPLDYLAGELLWYHSGSNDLNFINKFSSFWNKISDDNKTSNSAYGYILKQKHNFNQLDKMVELFRSDINTRRAVININVPNEKIIETKDEMCTISLMYIVRDGKLNCTCVMRSNDIYKGTTYDIPAFLVWQKYIADKLGIKMGVYTHFVHSLHVYDSDLDKVKRISDLGNDVSNKKLNIFKLLEESDSLIDYIKNSFTSKEDFLKLLVEKEVVKCD